MAFPEPNNFQEWVDTYKSELKPPVGNKLMHGAGQTKVMVVGGPNTRKDYHIEEGEEFFYMLKGDMQLNIIERGVHKHIPIREGEMFMLPARIPHSPQRFPDTIGLVLERERLSGELDGLRWYVGETDEVLFEDWFHCTDLGTQLKPIIEAFFASEEYRTQKPTRTFDSPGVDVDRETTVADPVNFKAWCASHAGTNAVLFDGEYRVVVMQAPETWAHYQFHEGEVFLWHHAGEAVVHMRHEGSEATRTMKAGDMLVIPRGTHFRVERSEGSVGMVVTNKKVANPVAPSTTEATVPKADASGAGAGGAGAGSS